MLCYVNIMVYTVRISVGQGARVVDIRQARGHLPRTQYEHERQKVQ